MVFGEGGSPHSHSPWVMRQDTPLLMRVSAHTRRDESIYQPVVAPQALAPVCEEAREKEMPGSYIPCLRQDLHSEPRMVWFLMMPEVTVCLCPPFPVPYHSLPFSPGSLCLNSCAHLREAQCVSQGSAEAQNR